jgi:hypothetical protein
VVPHGVNTGKVEGHATMITRANSYIFSQEVFPGAMFTTAGGSVLLVVSSIPHKNIMTVLRFVPGGCYIALESTMAILWPLPGAFVFHLSSSGSLMNATERQQ